ncbi:MAG: hypothetical protein Q8P05_01740 [Candidatus Diapherotrites archaeon]|nr:hypothetical protein [Candidatus Diapherotrites archaeon]MDZ4256345.1 hypothetical protein [archaeon]
MVNIYARALLLTILIVGAWVVFSYSFEGQRNADLLSQIDSVITQEAATRSYLDYLESRGEEERYCQVFQTHIQQQNEKLFPLLASLEEASHNALANDYIKVRQRFQSANAQLFFSLKLYQIKCPSSEALQRPILYFFPDNAPCSDCLLQSQILDDVRDTCKTPIQIFAFPVKGGIETVDLLVTDYQITHTPSLVIDDVVYPGVQTRTAIQELLAC